MDLGSDMTHLRRCGKCKHNKNTTEFDQDGRGNLRLTCSACLVSDSLCGIILKMLN